MTSPISGSTILRLGALLGNSTVRKVAPKAENTPPKLEQTKLAEKLGFKSFDELRKAVAEAHQNNNEDFLSKVRAAAKDILGDKEVKGPPKPQLDKETQAKIDSLATKLGYQDAGELGKAIFQAQKNGNQDFLSKVQSTAEALFGSELQADLPKPPAGYSPNTKPNVAAEPFLYDAEA